MEVQKISYDFLLKLGAYKECVSIQIFKKHFGINKEYTLDEVIEKVEKEKIDLNYEDFSWLLIECPKYQTEENLQKYLEMNKHDYWDFRCLLAYCKKYQTDENLKKYLEMNKHDYEDFRCLLAYCKKYHTKENLKIYLDMNKDDYEDFYWLLISCKKYQTENNLKKYLKMKPKQMNIIWFKYQCRNARDYFNKIGV